MRTFDFLGIFEHSMGTNKMQKLFVHWRNSLQEDGNEDQEELKVCTGCKE
jgi:hypothetical protein